MRNCDEFDATARLTNDSVVELNKSYWGLEHSPTQDKPSSG